MDKARAFFQKQSVDATSPLVDQRGLSVDQRSPLVDVVIHHSPCDDGHAAAAVFYHQNKDVILFGLHPKDDLFAKEGLTEAIRGKNVVFVDIAFPSVIMIMAASLAAKVVVLDHHTTNQTTLETLSLPNLVSVFTMDVAGVCLAWQFVHGDYRSIPRALYYIGLKDVWKHEENLSAVFFTTAFVRPKTWEGWIPYIEEWCYAVTDETIDKGQVIYEYQKEVIKTMMEKVQTTTWRGYKMAIVNVPFPWISDIGAQMCESDPVNTIAVVWNKQPTGQYSVSLRSHNPLGPNIEAIAAEFRGGGHGAGLRTNEPPYVVFSDTGIFQ